MSGPHGVATYSAVDVAGGIVRAFETAAVRAPDRTAIVAPTRTVTMADLAMHVEALCVRMRGKPQEAVLVTPRDAVVLAAGVIAAARMGLPCVLADPERPAPVLRRLAALVGATVVVGDVAPLDVSDVERASGGDEVSTTEAAVWIPTSGTTGDPSLVGITESGLLAMAVEAVALGIVVPGDRVARLSTHLGIGPLLTALVLDLPYVALDVRRLAPSRFLPFLAQHGVTYLHLAPTLLRTLLPEGEHSAQRTRVAHGGRFGPVPLRLIGSGGEALRWNDVTRIRRTFGADVEVLHTYSSTEAGMVTLRHIGPGEDRGTGAADPVNSTRVPVGRPLPGRDVWIDAGDGSPAPAGTVGHIVVTGRFGTVTPRAAVLPDGRQQLRTGDLGLLGTDGSLTFTGRAGRDGKIGLWRVDLGAVEDAIAALEGVLDVVVRPEESLASRRLIAHLLVDGRTDVTDDAVRSAVGGLASTAVPGRIVRHTGELPLLTSGKLNASVLDG